MKKRSESLVRCRPGPDDSVIIEKELWYFPMVWTPIGNVAQGVYQATEALNKHSQETRRLLRNLVEAKDNLKGSRKKLKGARYDGCGISEPYLEYDDYLKTISGSFSAPEPFYHETLSHQLLSEFGLSGAEKSKTRGPQKPKPDGRRTLITTPGNEKSLDPSSVGADSVEVHVQKKPEDNRNKNQQGKKGRGGNNNQQSHHRDNRDQGN